MGDDRVRNTVPNVNERAQIDIEMITTRQSRRFEPPPPYTPTDPALAPPVTVQPTDHQIVIVQPTFKDVPIYFCCPSCHKRCLTTIQFVNSHKTHMIAGFICGLTLWCMMCCLAAIPYTVRKFKKADHYCSNCNYYLGSYSSL